MVCLIMRHYPAYKIEDVFKLTPKQAWLMLESWGKERLEYIKMAAKLFGAKDEDDLGQEDDKITSEDYAKMQRLSSGKRKTITESFGSRNK